MGALDDLKTRIDEAIYQNTQQKITGEVLQDTLEDMVDTMGVSVSQNSLTIGGDYKGELSTTYDVTLHNDGATFASLEALMSDANLNTLIPLAVRKGGMSIKFVCSPDNKYMRYNLLADSFTTDTTQWAIDDVGVYVENPEFVYVKTDAEGKILWAIKTNGGIYYGAGVPQQVIDYIEEKIAELSLDEYEDIVAFLNGLEEGDKTLQTLLNEKVDKEEGKSLIDTEYASSQSAINSPQFLAVTTDSEDRVLEGIQHDGTKVFGGDLNVGGSAKVLGDMEVAGITYKVVENPKFLEIETDSQNRILGGRKKDGTKFENVAFETPEIHTNHLELTEAGKEALKSDLITIDSSVSENNAQNELKSAKEIFNLKKETKALSDEINSLKLTKNGNTQDEATINLRNTDKKKLIINLHKRANPGDAQTNDVFLPNANDNFSDVRVFDNTGKRLPYKVVCNGNFDIVPTLKFGHNALTKPWQNTDGNIIYSGSISSYKPCISTDNGETWNVLTEISDGYNNPVYISFVDKDDTLFIGDGPKLYRSAYPYTSKELVLDISDTNGNLISDNAYTGCHLLSTDICQHPDGELFLGSYQFENAIRIFKSTDGGLTWNKIFHSTDYQHIHHIYCDNNQTPAVIYAGCDNDNGLYVSHDKGSTWVDLNANRELIHSVDYGVIYSEEGFRLLGGETQHKGGHSIIRTTDDVHFAPTLSTGQACYMCYKLGNTLFAGLLSTLSCKCTQIVVSQDNGLSWNTAYTTMGVEKSTASDGFRLMQKLVEKGTNKEYIFVGCQNAHTLRQNDLLIYADNNSHFSQIIVEVPEGANSVRIESGYLISDNKEFVNDESIDNKILDIIPLNNSLLYESCSNKYITGNFNLSEPLKNIGNIVKPIISGNYSISLHSDSLPLRNIPMDISQCHAITISFWLKTEGSFSLNIIDGIFIRDSAFRFNDTWISSGGGNTLNVAKKFDLVLDFDNNKIKLYTNGTPYSYSDLIEEDVVFGTYQENDTWNLFSDFSSSYEVLISEFTIRNNAISQIEAYNEYYSKLNDNINF